MLLMPLGYTIRSYRTMSYLYLSIAIIAEVIATNALNASEGFTKLVPCILVVLGYGAAFYFLSLTLKSMPLGVASAIWAGLGIVLSAAVAAVIFKQTPDMPAMLGMALIILGVIVINVFSKTVSH